MFSSCNNLSVLFCLFFEMLYQDCCSMNILESKTFQKMQHVTCNMKSQVVNDITEVEV